MSTSAAELYEAAVAILDNHTARCNRCGFISAWADDFKDCLTGERLAKDVLAAFDAQEVRA